MWSDTADVFDWLGIQAVDYDRTTKMTEWMDEWMHQQTSEWTNKKWMNEQMNKQMNGLEDTAR